MVALTQTALGQETTNENSAIVLIEFQKSWTDKGFFHSLIKKQYTKRNVHQNTTNLLHVARNKGVKVIHAPLYIDKQDSNYKKMPLPARIFKQLTKDTWKSEFTDGVYEETDIIATGRYGFDATKGSDLVEILKANNIKTVYIGGFTTDHCVTETMETLISLGFECIMLADCTATRNKRLQKRSEAGRMISDSSRLIELLTVLCQ